jgi:hypothetical protein
VHVDLISDHITSTNFRFVQPCVFIGYSSIHKGYKCLDMDTDRVYISRDVVFDENVFPFAKPSSNIDHPI